MNPNRPISAQHPLPDPSHGPVPAHRPPMEMPASPPAAIHLQLGRIAVDGLHAADRRRFIRALDAQLRELATVPAFRQAAAQAGELSLPRLEAGVLRRGGTPEEAARQVASALKRRLLQPPREVRHG